MRKVAQPSREVQTATMSVVLRALAPGFVLAVAAIGCGSSAAKHGGGMGDCTQQIRAGGVVYASNGYSRQDVTRYATAEQAECDDIGKDAAGSVFPEHPRHVTTWTFAGYPSEHVLGVRFDKSSVAVFVADTVPRAEAERIYMALRRPSK